MESNSVCNHTRRSDKQITWSSDLFITSMITDRIGRHEVLLPIHDDYNKICDVSGFLKSKHKKFREFFASREEKKSFKRAHDGAYCPISAEISTIDSQSELRILLWLWLKGGKSVLIWNDLDQELC